MLMNILIIEDEVPAAKRLAQLILRARPKAQICTTLDSVEIAVQWFQTHPAPDLVFMDIQLADGLSFDIFTQIQVSTPVIFTTAFDQYTLKAFKVNSVDYLLKPIDPEELEKAITKYEQHFQATPSYNQNTIQQIIQAMTQPEYKERFIIKIGQQLTYVTIDNIRYFYSEEGLVYARTGEAKKHVVDYKLDQLEGILRPTKFFRINRKVITNISSIGKISTFFNSRLKLELKPSANFDVIVSRDRVSGFKKWLDK